MLLLYRGRCCLLLFLSPLVQNKIFLNFPFRKLYLHATGTWIIIFTTLLLIFSFSGSKIYAQRQPVKETYHLRIGNGHDTIFRSYDDARDRPLQRRNNLTNNTSPLADHPYHESKSSQNADSFVVTGSFIITIDTTGTSCGYYNGSMIVSASGGVAPYTYTYTFHGFPYTQTNGNFQNLGAGPYTVTVTDASGQIVSTAFNLTNDFPAPYVTAVATRYPSQCDSFDGIITLTGSGGVPPYLYSLDGLTYQKSNVFANLPQGFYTFFLQDAYGCIYHQPTGIFLNSLANCFALGFLYTGIACNNTSYIYLTVPMGGTAPYAYSLDGINYRVENYFDSLGPGLHPIYFKDAVGVVNIYTVLIFKYCPDIQIDPADASCNQSNGSIMATPLFGYPPYTYSLDGITYQGGNTFTGLSPGNYTVTVKDGSGQTISSSATLYENCPQVNPTTTDATCGKNNGSITANGKGGAAPYQYSLDGVKFQSNNVFTGLAPGNYTLTVKDANGFTATTDVTVMSNCMQLSVIVSGATCSSSNGSITMTAINGTVPYQYSIDGINFKSSNVFSGLSTGSYPIVVSDASGARLDSLVTIIDMPGPQVNATVTQASCNNTNGSIQINGTGGTLPLQYSIDNAGFQGNNIFNNLDSGKYVCYIKDANGCVGTDTVQLTTLLTPLVFLGNDTLLCQGENLVLAAPAALGYSYLWQNNTGGRTYMVAVPGTYYVTVTNQYNCSATDTILVGYTAAPAFTIGNDTSLCSGQMMVLSPTPAMQGPYLWNTGNTSPAITADAGGLYWVQVNYNGCVKRDSINITYKPGPSLNLGKDTTLCQDNTLTLDATNINATYVWQDGSGQSTYMVSAPGKYSVAVDMNGCNTSAAISVSYLTKPAINLGGDTSICVTEQVLLDATYPASTYLWQDGSVLPNYSVTAPGTYAVRVTNTCGVSAASIRIESKNCDCKFFMPSAFTPNNDGINDVFKPGYQCLFSNYEMKIYNRWGQLVYISQNPAEGWNGSYKSGSQQVGVYVWELMYKDNITGKIERKKGSVTLLR